MNFLPTWQKIGRMALVILVLAFTTSQRAQAQEYLDFCRQINDLLGKVEGATIYDKHLTGESTVIVQSFAPSSLTRSLKSSRYTKPIEYDFEFAWEDGWKHKWGRKNIGSLNDTTVVEIILEFEKPSKSTVDGSACCENYSRYFYFLATDAENAFRLFKALQAKP